MRISDWSSDVCSSDLYGEPGRIRRIRYDGQAAPGYSAGNQHIAPLLVYALDQRPQVGKGGIVGDGGQRRGAPIQNRKEARRGGKECVSKCRSRWASTNYKQQYTTLTPLCINIS